MWIVSACQHFKLPLGPNQQHSSYSECQMQLKTAGGIINKRVGNQSGAPFWGDTNRKWSNLISILMVSEMRNWGWKLMLCTMSSSGFVASFRRGSVGVKKIQSLNGFNITPVVILLASGTHDAPLLLCGELTGKKNCSPIMSFDTGIMTHCYKHSNITISLLLSD